LSKNISLFNFSWIEENVIAGSSFPTTTEHFIYLKKVGIKVIFNLTEKLNYQEWGIPKEFLDNFIFHHISIPDFTAPTIEQIIKFQKLVLKYQTQSFPILIHCIAGCGRTGTFLVAYLMSKTKNKSVEDILATLRKTRPCSVETDSQIKILKDYATIINQQSDN
jgi:atypical dual specificity phosphatase